MNFEANIGLEIHVELKTKSKMFSSSPIFANKIPNSNASFLDVGFPGAMPVVNKQAVVYAIQVANALHMEIDHELWFDRKNYFYSDSPKGFQITQFYRPIGKNGYLEIDGHKICIKEIHLEEDTCKQIHLEDKTLLDYNRSGIPLLEIVSLPEFKDGNEAMRFAQKIHQIVTHLGVSDGKMENGSLRCDVNVSLKAIGSTFLGKKVEIKNLNSFNNIKLSIEYEINRQVSLLLSGKEIVEQTRRFDEKCKKTVLMRMKSEERDYRYFVEPNIAPIKLSDGFIKEAISSSKELPDHKINAYMELGLSQQEAALLMENPEISNYFEEIICNNVSAKITANWINENVKFILNKNNITINQIKITPSNFAILIRLIENEEISNKQARVIFDKMLISNENPNSLKQELGASLLNDERLLTSIIEEITNENPQLIVDYQNGKDKVVGYISGLVLKKTKGNANPKLTTELVVKSLKGR